MAVNKTINIDINQNADEAAKGFNNLNKSLDATNESIRDVNATFEQVYGELQPLTTRLGEAEDRLYELALAGDTTSKEYQELLKTVANYRKVQIQTDLTVDNAATTLDQKLGGAIQGAVSGFAAVQGAMGLLGSESEQLEKTLLKVQSALAIAEGVRGIRENIGFIKQLGQSAVKALTGITKLKTTYKAVGEAIKQNTIFQKANNVATVAASAVMKLFGASVNQTSIGFKALRGAIIATGIGALVVGISALVSKIGDWISSEKELKEAAEARNRAVEEGIQAIEREAELAAARAELQGKRQSQILEQEKEFLLEKQELLKKAAEEEYKVYEELYEDDWGDINEETQAAYDKHVELHNQYLEVKQQINLKEIEIEKATKDEFIAIEQRWDGWLKAAREKRIQASKEFNEANKNLNRQIEDEQIKRIEDQEKREIKELEKTAKRRIEDLKNVKGSAQKKNQLEKEIQINLELEIEAIRQKYFKQRQEADLARLNEIQDFKAVEATTALNSLQDQLNKEILLRKAAADKEKEIEAQKAALRKRNQEFAVESTKQSLDLIISLTELFGKKSEKAARRAFNIQKGAQIASATIDTYRNAVSAYGSQFVPVPDPSSPVRGGIAAGIAVAAGLANIAQIASQKFEGGGGGGAVAEPSTAGLEGGAITPQFNVVGDSGINQLAQLQQQPVQAYVVSGEVTSAQALDRNRVKNATL